MNNNDDNSTAAAVDSNNTITPIRFQPLSGDKPAPAVRIRPRIVMVSASLLLCAAVAGFLFTAKAVYIEVNPASATVDIDGLLQLKLADRYLLLSGEHRVAVQADGYYPLQETLRVTREQDQRYAYTLQRLPGHLHVSTQGAIAASVFIDDRAVGSTPVLVRDLAPGTRLLRIEAERYFPLQQAIEVEGLDKEQQFRAELVPAWAELRFASLPAGADVFVDEDLLGQTPLHAQILQGRHKVRLKLAGHKPWLDEVDVIAGKDLELGGVQLEPADALVFLATDPPRANVTVDGDYAGLTPLELALTPGKRSTIKLFKQGYKSASRELTVTSGEETRLQVKLVAELVDVAFNIMPQDAKLYIDGQLQDSARRLIQLPARTHRIEVRRQGYLDFETRITPHPDIAQQVNVSLKSEQQVKIESIKPLYSSSAGQSMKLFYPGAFTMGASRREPGRRANETLRKIELKRPFYMSTHEVTNAQYRKFSSDHSSGSVQGTSLDGDNQPVANISWEQAAKYCNWLSKTESLTPFYRESGNGISGFNPAANGYRMPTEAEWAWAARTSGKDGLLKFPWGEQMPPPARSGNYADQSTSGFLGQTIAAYDDGYIVSAPAGSFPANAKGLFDMGGNVAEWVSDFYDIQVGSGDKAELDPLGPGKGEFHVIRGSSWAHGTLTELRLSYRDYNAKARDDVGFRIARYLE